MRKSKSYNKIISECLNAVVNGPFFPDWEFATLFGLTREEIKKILDKWPAVDEENEDIKIAINNSFNNLLGYPIANDDKWPEYISINRNKLRVIFADWRKKKLTLNIKKSNCFIVFYSSSLKQYTAFLFFSSVGCAVMCFAMSL